MEVSQVLSSASQQAGTAQDPHHPRESQRHLLRLEEGLSLATLAARVSTLGDGLLLVQKVANRRDSRTAFLEMVARRWAEEWAKVGVKPDWEKLLPRRGFQVLLRRWVVERTFAWLSQNRRMSKDYERLCAIAEAFIYVAMTRLIVRRLPRA